MEDSEHVLRARLRWVTNLLETGNARLTCRRCGISEPTLRKWARRYKAEGRVLRMEFQLALMQERIRFRPIWPYSLHLNGKVERPQRTDWMEGNLLRFPLCHR